MGKGEWAEKKKGRAKREQENISGKKNSKEKQRQV